MANEPVNEGVGVENDVGGGFIKAVDGATELRRGEIFGKGRRSADVREEHGDLDLGSPGMLPGHLYAGVAEAGIGHGLAATEEKRYDGRTDTFERRVAG